jgi:DNA primase
MGRTLSPVQEKLLLERFRRVVLLLDGDEPGRWARAAMAARLAGKCRLRVVCLCAGEQPDQLSSEQIRQLLNQEVGV